MTLKQLLKRKSCPKCGDKTLMVLTRDRAEGIKVIVHHVADATRSLVVGWRAMPCRFSVSKGSR